MNNNFFVIIAAIMVLKKKPKLWKGDKQSSLLCPVLLNADGKIEGTSRLNQVATHL